MRAFAIVVVGCSFALVVLVAAAARAAPRIVRLLEADDPIGDDELARGDVELDRWREELERDARSGE